MSEEEVFTKEKLRKAIEYIFSEEYSIKENERLKLYRRIQDKHFEILLKRYNELKEEK